MQRRVSFGGPLTPAMKWIMINTFIVWLAQLLLIYVGPYRRFFTLFALYTEGVLSGKVWQLFTYMFLHDTNSPIHLLFNLIILYMFGGQMEKKWGSKYFVLFYFLCGIAGGVLVVLWGLFFAGHPTLGASGAILGVLAAYCMTWPERSIYLFGVLPLKGKHLLLITIGMDFLYFLVPNSGISFQAHMGGLGMGVLLTTGYWHPRKIKERYRIWSFKRKIRSRRSDEKDNVTRGPWLH